MELHTQSFDAFGCTGEITVLDPSAVDAAFEIAWTHVAAIEFTCNRFRDDSELAQLNATGEAVVSRLLLEAVDVALAAVETTGGAVDPTVGAALRTGWGSVEVDRERSTIRLRPGTELYLGATVKALAADLIAAHVERETSSPVLVSLGGDVAAAGDAPEGGWPVRLSDDYRVGLGGGGLATSCTSEPELWRTVSVAAPTCVGANIAATAAFVFGAAAPGWLAARGLPARLVRRDGSVETVAGWPAETRNVAGWAA